MARRVAAGAGLSCVGMVAATGPAAAVAAPPPAADSDPAAVAALERAALAERSSSWSGTQYVATFDGATSASAVLLVRHVAGQGTVVAPASGGGAPITAPDPAAQAPALAVSGLDGGAIRLLEQTYALALDQCGGQRCVVVRRRDGSVAARLWVDPTTGVVGRRELYDDSGRVARASAFVDLHADPRPSSSTVPAVLPAAAEQRLGDAALRRLEQEGWVVPRVLPGALVLFDAEEARADGAEVLHLAYSDGLSEASLFEERGTLDAGALRGWHTEHTGGTTYWDGTGIEPRAVWSGSGRTWTLVASTGAAQARAITRALPHDHPPGLLTRLRRGLARAWDWLTGSL